MNNPIIINTGFPRSATMAVANFYSLLGINARHEPAPFIASLWLWSKDEQRGAHDLSNPPGRIIDKVNALFEKEFKTYRAISDWTLGFLLYHIGNRAGSGAELLFTIRDPVETINSVYAFESRPYNVTIDMIAKKWYIYHDHLLDQMRAGVKIKFMFFERLVKGEYGRKLCDIAGIGNSEYSKVVCENMWKMKHNHFKDYEIKPIPAACAAMYSDLRDLAEIMEL